MQKRMNGISMVAGYGMLVIALFFKILGGEQQRFSLIGAWFRSLISGDFLHFWRTGFSSGMGVLVGTAMFLLLAVLYIADAVLITCQRKLSFLDAVKSAWLYFTMFFYFIFIKFFNYL